MSETAAYIAKPGAAIRGLYAVRPDESDTAMLAAKVSAVLKGGAVEAAARKLAARSWSSR